MAGEEVERRIEEELRRRERAAREPPAPEDGSPPTAPERRARPGAEPAPQGGPDVEALFRRLRGEIDAMEGRMTAGIDAVAKRLAPVPEAAAEVRNWVRGAKAAVDAINSLAPVLGEAAERQNRIHRPARRRARFAAFLLALALTAAVAILAQWRFAIVDHADPSAGWRDHVWDRYGAELRECAVRADREGKAMLCTVFDPEPVLP